MQQQVKDHAFGIVPIFRQDGHDWFLLIQHKAGHWGFPKGHAEPGETAIIAACREFEEETGIRAYQILDHTPFVETYTLSKKQRQIEKTVTYFTAFVQVPRVKYQKKEIQDYAWLLLQDALLQVTFAQSKQLLHQVYQHLKAHT